MNMKRIVIFALAVLFITAMAVIQVNASPRIESGHYDIDILENGNAEITETWVVRFDTEQTYTRYYRSYIKNYYNITDWSATLDGKKMNKLPAVDNSRPDYSFAVETTGNEYIIHLYNNSYDIQRVFTISYTVENAVKIYDDIADFVWDLTGESEASTIGALTATVNVPQGAELDDFRIWAHGPERGTFIKDSETKASLHIDNVYSSQIVDIRVSLPPYLFDNGYYVGGDGLDKILVYEKGLADDANAKREEADRYWRELDEWEENHPVMSWFRYSDLATLLFIFFVIAGFALMMFFPGRARKMLDKKSMPKYIPEQNPEYYRILPDDIPPAVLNNLFTQFKFPQFKLTSISKSRGSAFSATMLDLFAEGYLEMRKTMYGDIEIIVNSEKIPGHNYEQTLISLITDAAGGGIYVTLNEIQRYINANQTDVYDKKRQFEKEVNAEATESPYIEEYRRDKSGLGWAYLILLGITGLFGTYFSLYIASQSMEIFTVIGYGIALIFTSMAGFLCLTISKKGAAISQFGTNKSALWYAFGRFLDDFTSFREKEFPEFKLWEKYLVYATALGKSKKLIQELALQYPAENIDTGDIDNEYTNHGIFTELLIAGTLLDTIDDIQSKAYSASPPSSDDSGGGGGFSSSGGSSGSGSSGSGFD